MIQRSKFVVGTTVALNNNKGAIKFMLLETKNTSTFVQDPNFGTNLNSHSVPNQFGNEIAILITNANILIKNKEWDLACHLLRKALYFDSYHLEALRKLFECSKQKNNLNLCLKIQQTIVKIHSNYKELSVLAGLFYDLNMFEQSKDTYFKALNKVTPEDMDFFEAFKNLGNIFLRQGDLDSAEEFYHKAFAINAQSDTLLVNLGTLSLQTDDFNLALSRFRTAVELNPKNDKAWVGLAISHFNMGDLLLAKANLETAIDVNKTNRTAVHLYSKWELEAKNYLNIIDVLTEFLAHVEVDQELSLILIHVACLSGNLGIAKIEIDKLLLWNPADPELLKIEAEIKGLLK